MRIYEKDGGMIELTKEEIRAFIKTTDIFLHTNIWTKNPLPEVYKLSKQCYEMLNEFKDKFIVTNLDE